MAKDTISLECEEHGFTAKNPYQMTKHRREQHPKGTRGPRTGTSTLTKVPANLEGTPKGDAIEILIESRKVNADEVARVDAAIAWLLKAK